MFADLFRVLDAKNILLAGQVVSRAKKSGDANRFMGKYLQMILDLEDGVLEAPLEKGKEPQRGPTVTVVENHGNRGHRIPRGRQ